jgi:hypothetical protein
MEGSGLPVPRRRPFASGILPSAHSDAAIASPSWLRLAAYAGSRGTGSPELSSGLRNLPSGWRASGSRDRVSDADPPGQANLGFAHAGLQAGRPGWPGQP